MVAPVRPIKPLRDPIGRFAYRGRRFRVRGRIEFTGEKMITVYSDDHRLQNGRVELNDGKLVPCFEMPRRADIILARIRETGLGEVVDATDHGEEPLRRVHTDPYVDFLKTAHAAWRAEHGDTDALPLNWLARGMRNRVPESIDGKLGLYSFDAGTPITAGTWAAATASANVAMTGADLLLGNRRTAFSLCRPPGHHAGSDFYGGYCFLNNAAVAAQYLRDKGASKVAVFDIDYHHGNGTQEIFWERDDVFFVSIHADPSQEFPYFLGYADETGVGRGEGFTLNLPLRWGVDYTAYAAALETASRRIASYAPDVLIVSLGADTYEHDPISRFRLRGEDFNSLGRALAAMDLPTLFVMEGGYAVDALGVNVVTLLAAFENGMRR